MKKVLTILLALSLVGQIYAQTATISITSGFGLPDCMVTDADLSITSSSTDPDDNKFRYNFSGTHTNGIFYEINWNTTSKEWELEVGNNTVIAISDEASFPYPPNYTFGNWQNQNGFCSLTKLEGTGTQSVLPVELTSFEAKKEANVTVLNWQTATEENNEGFDIQRSTDVETWESIGFVAGAGTTLEVQDYEFTDTEAKAGKFYYRLKQIDFDGQFEYSEVVTVELTSLNNDVAIYPNPVSNNLTIEGVQGIATIHNLLGQPVKEFSINNEQENIDLSDLTEGQYLLMIQAANGERVIQQFVKQ